MKYTLDQLNEICKKPERVEELLEQNNVLRSELGLLLKRIIRIEKIICELQADVNELNINQDPTGMID